MVETEENFIVEIADVRGMHKISVSPEEYAYMMNVGIPVYSDQSIQRELEPLSKLAEPELKQITELDEMDYSNPDVWGDGWNGE